MKDPGTGLTSDITAGARTGHLFSALAGWKKIPISAIRWPSGGSEPYCSTRGRHELINDSSKPPHTHIMFQQRDNTRDYQS